MGEAFYADQTTSVSTIHEEEETRQVEALTLPTQLTCSQRIASNEPQLLLALGRHLCLTVILEHQPWHIETSDIAPFDRHQIPQKLTAACI